MRCRSGQRILRAEDVRFLWESAWIRRNSAGGRSFWSAALQPILVIPLSCESAQYSKCHGGQVESYLSRDRSCHVTADTCECYAYHAPDTWTGSRLLAPSALDGVERPRKVAAFGSSSSDSAQQESVMNEGRDLTHQRTSGQRFAFYYHLPAPRSVDRASGEGELTSWSAARNNQADQKTHRNNGAKHLSGKMWRPELRYNSDMV